MGACSQRIGFTKVLAEARRDGQPSIASHHQGRCPERSVVSTYCWVRWDGFPIVYSHFSDRRILPADAVQAPEDWYALNVPNSSIGGISTFPNFLSHLVDLAQIGAGYISTLPRWFRPKICMYVYRHINNHCAKLYKQRR